LLPENHDALIGLRLSQLEVKLLEDIRDVLSIFNAVQELLSSERTPTLAVSLPAYEYCMQTLSEILVTDSFPHLDHAIGEALMKIQKYVQVARTNRTYGLSMCKYIAPL
jgi:flagellin-specific chaperone FliS